MPDSEVNAATLGVWLGVSDRTIRELAAKGTVTKAAKRGRYQLQASVKAYATHLREVAAGRGGEDQILDLTAERARLAKEQADAQALKNATQRGGLVPTTVVAAEWANMIRLIRSNMLAVPARCRQRNSAFGIVETELIRREITEALEAIAHDQDLTPPSAGNGDATA